MRLDEFLEIPTHSVELPGTRISYRRLGQGEPLLFIHGWPLVSATYRKLLPRLRQHFDCILPDSPGLGASSWDASTGFHFAQQAETWQAFTAAIGLKNYALAAHDTGATIARLLTASEGERVRKLVIFDTEIPHHRPAGADIGLKLLNFRSFRWLFRKLLGRRSFVTSKRGFGYAYHDKKFFDEEFYSAYVQPLLDDDRRWEGAMRYVRAVDWSVVDALVAVHATIECPVRLIWGARDSFFPLAAAEEMAGQFPHCTGLTRLPDAGLMSYEEQPELAVDAMLEFLL